MPELFRIFGMKFFFYSLEHNPPHVHVKNADGNAKFNLFPTVELVQARGMKPKDLVLAEAMINERRDFIASKWDEIHKPDKRD